MCGDKALEKSCQAVQYLFVTVFYSVLWVSCLHGLYVHCDSSSSANSVADESQSCLSVCLSVCTDFESSPLPSLNNV